MLNEHPAEQLLSKADVEAMIESRLTLALVDTVSHAELTQRLADVEQRASDRTLKLIADAEGRLNDTVIGLVKSFDTMADRLGEWKASIAEQVNARSSQVSSLQGAITSQGEAIGLLQQKRIEDEGAIRALTTTIHGDPTVKADAPSLFESVNGIRTGIQTMNDTLSNRLETVRGVSEENANWIRRFKEDQALQRQRRERRWSYINRVGNWIAKNPVITGILTLILVGLIYALWPQLGDFLKAFLHIP